MHLSSMGLFMGCLTKSGLQGSHSQEWQEAHLEEEGGSSRVVGLMGSGGTSQSQRITGLITGRRGAVFRRRWSTGRRRYSGIRR